MKPEDRERALADLYEEPRAPGEPRKVTERDLEADAASTMAFMKAMGAQPGARIRTGGALPSGTGTDTPRG